MVKWVRRVIALAVVVVVLLLIFGGRLVSLYVDFLWFQSVGYSTVFSTILVARLAMFAIGAVAFLVIFVPNVAGARAASLRLLRRLPARIVEVGNERGPFASIGGGRDDDGERIRPFREIASQFGGSDVMRWAVERVTGTVLLVIGVLLALFMALAAAGDWQVALQALHATPFGLTDPIFSHDVSFYVFIVPALRTLQDWLFWCVLLTTIAVVVAYVLALYSVDPTFEQTGFLLGGRARIMRTHLLVLGAVLIALVAASIWLDTYDVLQAEHTRMMGANFTDVHAVLPATRTLAVVAALTGLFALITVFRRSYSLLFAGAVLFGAVLVLGRMALPTIVQRLQVEPAELAQERPYIANNIQYTRHAFGLQDVDEQTFPADDTVRPEEIRANTQTITNVRLWDHGPLGATYKQVQSIRPYYAFDPIDVDRYMVQGQYRQVMISPRELDVAQLGSQAQTWVNQRLQYTHGYGAAMSPVNEISPEGLPTFFIKDIPPTGLIPTTRPEVYFGERTGSYVIVDTGTQEFDYPRGDQNVFSTYAGSAGVPINSIWRRFGLAWYFGDFNFLVSTYLKTESRVLFRRSIDDRIQRIAPFLKLDRDPYLVVADGKLVWIQDAYTMTDQFPYAQFGADLWARQVAAPSDPNRQGPATPFFLNTTRYNYIRNSAKITVDAYDGTVRVYLADDSDPIAATYSQIFPDLFRPLSEMPPSLRAHVRYPEDLFQAQALVLRAYHVQEAQIFYNGEDQWATASERAQDQRSNRLTPLAPYYIITRLPGQTSEEFVLMLPFTPTSRDNMIAWLSARSDAPNYGKLILYKLPKDRLIYGPAQIDSRIDQDTAISQQLSLWNQQGSQVLRGNLLVVPIGNSTLYVEPIYLQATAQGGLQATQSSLPELKRVVVATGSRLAMEPTLEEALARLFGPDIGVPIPQPSGLTAPPPPAAAGATPAPTAVPGATPAPGGTPAAISAAEASRAARAAYQNAIDALKQGDFARFGQELKALDDRLRDVERATGAS